MPIGSVRNILKKNALKVQRNKGANQQVEDANDSEREAFLLGLNEVQGLQREDQYKIADALKKIKFVIDEANKNAQTSK